MKVVAYISDMHTYTRTRTWLAVGAFLVSLMRAQLPWTQWGIYADSTGNGQVPVHGTLQCHNDTFWLVVDTTGMGAAGITSWRWRSVGGSPEVVYAPSLPSVPAPFPIEGLPDRKVGVKPLFVPQTIQIALITYFANGDSAGFVHSLRTKGGFPLWTYTPSVVCVGTPVSLDIHASDDIDSFKVIYGSGPSDYVSNQPHITLTAPSSAGPWNLTLRAYFCGDSISSLLTIQVVSNVSSLPFSPTASSLRICPGDSVVLNVSSPSDLAGVTNLSIQIKAPNGTPVHTATGFPVKWVAPNNAVPGSYAVEVTATYACGNYTQSYSDVFRVRGTGGLSTPSLSGPNDYCPGTSAMFWLWSVEGLVSVDIGNDGSWEYVGVGSSFSHIFPTGTTFPVDIKIRQDVGCDNREDVLTWNPTSANAPPQFPFVSNGPWCPGPNRTVRIYGNAANFTSGAPGNYIRWEASWLPTPFYGVSNDTVIPAPSTPGSYTITATLYTPCGDATTTRPLLDIFSHPSPAVIGRVCASTGGSVLIAFPPAPLLADSVRYYLPDGTSVAVQGTDTFVYNVLPNTAAATLLAKIMYGGCHARYYTVNIPIIGNVRAKLMNVTDFGTACANEPFWIFMNSLDAQEVRIYLGSNLVALWIPSGSFVSGTLVAPSSAGTYTYTIVAVGCGGNDTAQASLVVSGTGAVADFSAPGSACVGIPITFQRNGTNNGIASASWYFGDGSTLTDTSMSVSHTYASPGIYTVFLSVAGTCGSSSMQKTIKVYGNAPSLSGLNIIQSGNTITGTVSATDADSVKWFFDAPNATPSASGTSVSHTYAATGIYTVMVVAYNPCGTDTVIQNVTIGSTSALLSSRSGEWTLYPNPARGEVHLVNPAYTGAAQVRIFDLQGRLVETHAVQSFPARLSINLPTGLYQVQLITERGVETLRLAVE